VGKKVRRVCEGIALFNVDCCEKGEKERKKDRWME